jgi:hypothetical protein
MSVPPWRRLLVTLEPRWVSRVTGQFRDDHRMRGIVRVTPANDRM